MITLSLWDIASFYIWLGGALNNRPMIFIGAGLWAGWGVKEILRDLRP